LQVLEWDSSVQHLPWFTASFLKNVFLLCAVFACGSQPSEDARAHRLASLNELLLAGGQFRGSCTAAPLRRALRRHHLFHERSRGSWRDWELLSECAPDLRYLVTLFVHQVKPCAHHGVLECKARDRCTLMHCL